LTFTPAAIFQENDIAMTIQAAGVWLKELGDYPFIYFLSVVFGFNDQKP